MKDMLELDSRTDKYNEYIIRIVCIALFFDFAEILQQLKSVGLQGIMSMN